MAAGTLVEEGKLTWDRPIRESVPSIEFYDNALNNTVTLRDMLAHRTGVTRHDSIWYKSDYTAKDLFQRLKYLEPKEPPRQLFLYNNMMYAGVGYSIQLQSGKPWGDYVREKILSTRGSRCCRPQYCKARWNPRLRYQTARAKHAGGGNC